MCVRVQCPVFDDSDVFRSSCIDKIHTWLTTDDPGTPDYTSAFSVAYVS